VATVGGAARKTANTVLGTAYGVASGVVVDTHVQRIAGRLDLTRYTEPVKIEQDLIEIPKEKWILFPHQVILHGRALCVARQPKCGECQLNGPLCQEIRRRSGRCFWRSAGVLPSASATY
jgi:endonuclease-3